MAQTSSINTKQLKRDFSKSKKTNKEKPLQPASELERETSESGFKKALRQDLLFKKRQIQTGFKDSTEALVKKVTNKQIWEIMAAGLGDPFTFIPSVILFDAYFFISLVLGNSFSKFIPKLDIWQTAVLGLANLTLLLIIFIGYLFVTLMICFASVGLDCPVSLWTIISGLWGVIF